MSQVDGRGDSPDEAKAHARAEGRAEAFLKTFEWTWTNAVVFSLGLVFFLLITMSVIPSFWLYFAEQKLGWDGPTERASSDRSAPRLLRSRSFVRDAIAMGLTTVPSSWCSSVAAIMQNWRRKLRGGAADRPTGGYR